MKDYESFLHKLTKTRLSCGRNLTELATYRDVPLWLFANFRFYSFMTDLLEKRDLSARNSLTWMTYKTFEPFLSFSKMMFAGFAMKFYGRWKRNCRNGQAGIPKILFTSENVEWRVIRDFEHSSLKKTDAFFDAIISKSGHEYKYVGVYPIGLSTRGLKILVDKLRNWNILYKPFELYWSLDALRRESEAFRYFRQLWKELNNDEKFKRLCTYNGRNLYSEIGAELRFYLLVVFPRFIKNIEIARQMLSREKPDLILIEEEYGEFERALTVAGKLKNIRTIAIQHGEFTLTDFSYIFEEEDKERMILPDFTAVYGKHYYDLLTKDSIYEPEQVIVTGQPRYDILCDVDRIYSKEKFLREHKINPFHKILLWTTQSHGLSDKENAENLKTVFETMENIENVTLIIKQHPGEGERFTRMINNYLSNHEVEAVLTEKNSDTYEQIYVCDLLMTKTSTTALEAVALKKPVIILNLSGIADTVDYVQQGVALGVHKGKDLRTVIERLLTSDIELARNREQYIQKYLYKTDGKATERVLDLIGKIISKEKRYHG